MDRHAPTIGGRRVVYRAWGALLAWVNEQRRIVPPFPRPTPGHPIDASLANQIRKVVWADDALRERFLAEGASDLGDAERDLIASWRHRISGPFIVLKHLQKHSIFMSKDVYAVLGIYTPFAELIPFVPTYVQAVLIPFRDVIITDGFLESPPMQISFGGAPRNALDPPRRRHRMRLQQPTCPVHIVACRRLALSRYASLSVPRTLRVHAPNRRRLRNVQFR